MSLNKLELCTDFLQEHGSLSTKHSGRSLYVHLKRTYDILSAASLSEDVCFAGLFHSIYGNNIFKHQTLDSKKRQDLRDLIGDYAELLVWKFCELERPSSLHAYVDGEKSLKFANGDTWEITSQDEQILDDLLSIETANLLDQQVLWRHKWLIPHAKKVGLLTSTGFNVLRESKSYIQSRKREIEGMLDSARLGARLILIDKLNNFRASLSSDLMFGADLRNAKFQQALMVIDAHSNGHMDKLDLESCELIKNYADSYGLDLLEASHYVVTLRSNFEKGLYKTEMIKDAFCGRLSQANSLSAIDQIKREITALDQEQFI